MVDTVGTAASNSNIRLPLLAIFLDALLPLPGSHISQVMATDFGFGIVTKYDHTTNCDAFAS